MVKLNAGSTGAGGERTFGRSAQWATFIAVSVAGLAVTGVFIWKAFAGQTPESTGRGQGDDEARLQKLSDQRRAATGAQAERLRQQGVGTGVEFDESGRFLGAPADNAGLPRNRTLDEVAGGRHGSELSEIRKEIRPAAETSGLEESPNFTAGGSGGHRRAGATEEGESSAPAQQGAEPGAGGRRTMLGYSTNAAAAWAVRRPSGGSQGAGEGRVAGPREGEEDALAKVVDGAMKAQERLLGSSGRVPSSIASLAAGAGTATAQVEGQGGERRNFYAEERGGGQDVADMRVSAEAVRQEVVRQGKFLDCALVTRLRADLVESEVVAMVVRDFVTLDGETVLVPAGTKLLGRAGAVQNVQQARVYLQFERLIYPDQRSAYFRRKSPATDALGAAGVDGDVDRHFFLQFGSALLLGVLDGLAAAVQGVASGGADPSVRDMILGRTSSNLATVVAGILNRYGNVVPTITVEPGAKLKVYFAEDVILTPYRATVPPARWGRGAGPAELPVNRWQRGLRR